MCAVYNRTARDTWSVYQELELRKEMSCEKEAEKINHNRFVVSKNFANCREEWKISSGERKAFTVLEKVGYCKLDVTMVTDSDVDRHRR